MWPLVRISASFTRLGMGSKNEFCNKECTLSRVTNCCVRLPFALIPTAPRNEQATITILYRWAREQALVPKTHHYQYNQKRNSKRMRKILLQRTNIAMWQWGCPRYNYIHPFPSLSAAVVRRLFFYCSHLPLISMLSVNYKLTFLCAPQGAAGCYQSIYQRVQ